MKKDTETSSPDSAPHTERVRARDKKSVIASAAEHPSVGPIAAATLLLALMLSPRQSYSLRLGKDEGTSSESSQESLDYSSLSVAEKRNDPLRPVEINMVSTGQNATESIRMPSTFRYRPGYGSFRVFTTNLPDPYTRLVNDAVNYKVEQLELATDTDRINKKVELLEEIKRNPDALKPLVDEYKHSSAEAKKVSDDAAFYLESKEKSGGDLRNR